MRITEIIPYDIEDKLPDIKAGVEGSLKEISYYLKLLTRQSTYYTRDIVVFQDGRYKMINPISDRLAGIILIICHLIEGELLKFNTIEKGGIDEAV